jgi:DNA-binding HxlR family transcriptional regulator
VDALFKALSNPESRDVLKFIQAKSLVRFTEMKKHFNCSPSSLSTCLRSLLEANLIAKTTDGRYQLSYVGARASDYVKRLEDLAKFPSQVDQKNAPYYELVLSFSFKAGEKTKDEEERGISKTLNEAFMRFMSRRPERTHLRSFIEVRFKKVKKRTFGKYVRWFQKNELVDLDEDERVVYLKEEKSLAKIPSKVLERCDRTKWFELKENLRIPLISGETTLPYIIVKLCRSATVFEVSLIFTDTFRIFGDMPNGEFKAVPFQMLKAIGLELGYEYVFYVNEIANEFSLAHVSVEYNWGIGKSQFEMTDLEYVRCPDEEITAAWILSRKIPFLGMSVDVMWAPAMHATPLLEKIRRKCMEGFEEGDLLFPFKTGEPTVKLSDINDGEKLYEASRDTLLPSLAAKIMNLLKNENPMVFNGLKRYLCLEDMIPRKLPLSPDKLDEKTSQLLRLVIEKTYSEYETFEENEQRLEATIRLGETIYPFICKSFPGNPKDWITVTASTAYHYMAYAENKTIEKILVMDLSKLKRHVRRKIDTLHIYDEVYSPFAVIDKQFFQFESIPLCELFKVQHEALQKLEEEWGNLKNRVLSLLESGSKSIDSIQQTLKLDSEKNYWLTHVLLQLILEGKIDSLIKNGHFSYNMKKNKDLIKHPQLYQFVGPFWSTFFGGILPPRF